MCHGLSPARGFRMVFGRIPPGSKPLIFTRFHAVLFGNQHEIWSKPHNGKVSDVIAVGTGGLLDIPAGGLGYVLAVHTPDIELKGERENLP
jgi:hypothetical protein